MHSRKCPIIIWLVLRVGMVNMSMHWNLWSCSLVKNSHNVKARGLKAVLLRKLNRVEAAEKWRAENLELDAFDYVTLFENVLAEKDADEFQERSRGFYETYLQTARDYAEYGCLEEAICILKSCAVQQP